MLEGNAFLTIVIAAITSTFVARAEAEHKAAPAREEKTVEERIEARLDDLPLRLARIETIVSSRASE